jgi:hypothetical protein
MAQNQGRLPPAIIHMHSGKSRSTSSGNHRTRSSFGLRVGTRTRPAALAKSKRPSRNPSRNQSKSPGDAGNERIEQRPKRAANIQSRKLRHCLLTGHENELGGKTSNTQRTWAGLPRVTENRAKCPAHADLPRADLDTEELLLTDRNTEAKNTSRKIQWCGE